MKIYLAGPISGCTDEEMYGWRLQLEDKFIYLYEDSNQHYEILTISPADRDYRNKEKDSPVEIVQQDKMDINNSDVVVARCMLPFTRPFVGTSMEIMYAYDREKPILIWADKGIDLSPWILYHATCIVYSEQEVIDKIKEWYDRF